MSVRIPIDPTGKEEHQAAIWMAVKHTEEKLRNFSIGTLQEKKKEAQERLQGSLTRSQRWEQEILLELLGQACEVGQDK